MQTKNETGYKKDLNRENILKIAREIFSKYGFKKTTLDDIANAVRKGKSSLYYYFESKEDLFQAVIMKEVDILGHELEIVINRNTTSLTNGYATLSRQFILWSNTSREQNHIGFKMTTIGKIHAVTRFSTRNNFVGTFLCMNFYTQCFNFATQ